MSKGKKIILSHPVRLLLRIVLIGLMLVLIWLISGHSALSAGAAFRRAMRSCFFTPIDPELVVCVDEDHSEKLQYCAVAESGGKAYAARLWRGRGLFHLKLHSSFRPSFFWEAETPVQLSSNGNGARLVRLPVRGFENCPVHIALKSPGDSAVLSLFLDSSEYPLEQAGKQGDWFLFRFPYHENLPSDPADPYRVWDGGLRTRYSNYVESYMDNNLPVPEVVARDIAKTIFFRLRTYDAAGNLLLEEDIEP